MNKKNIKNFSLAIGVSVYLLSTTAYANESKKYVNMDSEYSHEMMDPNTNITTKQKMLFNNKDHYLKEGEMNFGVSFIGIANLQQSNRDSKFGYLMRHPTANNQVGKQVSEVAVHSVQLQASGSFTPWMSLYSELLYSPEQSFGAGTTTSLTRNLVQVRKAYVLIGDKNCNPFYFTLGKQDLPFGMMDTVNPFTGTTVWHAFGGLAYSAILGVDLSGFNASVAAVQGGAQFRSANAPVKQTSTPSQINNFTGDINYTKPLADENSSIKLGASIIGSSAYVQDFPVTHFSPGKKKNPAFDFYAKLKINNFDLQGEFAQTLKKWPGTHNPSAPLNVFAASKVTSFAVGTAYTIPNAIYNKDTKISLEFSQFRSGPKKSPWHRQDQIVGGVTTYVKPSVKLFAEIVRTQGYVPLNKISGDDVDAAGKTILGTTHSDKGARSTVFLLGIHASL
jgi:hypothetical protein